MFHSDLRLTRNPKTADWKNGPITACLSLVGGSLMPETGEIIRHSTRLEPCSKERQIHAL